MSMICVRIKNNFFLKSIYRGMFINGLTPPPKRQLLLPAEIFKTEYITFIKRFVSVLCVL